MNETTVHIKHLITEVDMRPTRMLTKINWYVLKGLGRGQICLMLNRKCTIARFVDCERTIHTVYAKDGEQFDLATIESMIQKRTLAIGVRVVRSVNVKAKRVKGVSLERKRVVKKAPVRRKRRAA